jgi:hypothetical protein
MLENEISAAGKGFDPSMAGKRFVDFILPVLAGFVAFGLGCSLQVPLSPGAWIGLLLAVPLILFLFIPLILKIPFLTHKVDALPDWLKTGVQWLVLLAYALLLGTGFRLNLSAAPVWTILLQTFLLLSFLFFLLYITRRSWILYLPLILPWEGRIRLMNLILILFMLVWSFAFRQSVPIFLLIVVLVCLGLCLALSLLRLCREKRSVQSYLQEVSGFVFLLIGFLMLMFSVR